MADRILFFGSGDFSIPIIQSLNKKYCISAIVTQPDRQQGRGKKIKISSVKNIAVEKKIPILQPEKLSEAAFRDAIEKYDPDLIVLAAYGKIIPKWILDYPKYGCLNVHASLLPRWRGASPIQSAIIEGDKKTGVTIMMMDEGLDTGPLLAQISMSIDPCENALTLESKLSRTGAELLMEVITKYEKKEIEPQPQKEDEATYCGLIKKEDGFLDFEKSAIILERQVRAFNPWPICYMIFQGQRLRVLLTKVSQTRNLNPNHRGILNKLPAVGTADFDLILNQVQMPGKKIISGREFLNGIKNWEN